MILISLFTLLPSHFLELFCSILLSFLLHHCPWSSSSGPVPTSLEQVINNCGGRGRRVINKIFYLADLCSSCHSTPSSNVEPPWNLWLHNYVDNNLKKRWLLVKTIELVPFSCVQGKNAPSPMECLAFLLLDLIPIIQWSPIATHLLTWFPPPTRGMYCSSGGGESWRSCKYD